MRRARRYGAGISAALVALIWLPAVAVAEPKHAPLKAFFGHYVGKGVTKSSRADYYGLRNRDLNVTITPVGQGGFKIEWKTIRQRARRKAKIQSTTLTFLPAQLTNVWRAQESGSIFAGKSLSWARIEKRSLIVYIMALQPTTGRVQLSVYRRRLAPKGLYLQFRRIVEGRSDRFVEALLNRAKK